MSFFVLFTLVLVFKCEVRVATLHVILNYHNKLIDFETILILRANKNNELTMYKSSCVTLLFMIFELERLGLSLESLDKPSETSKFSQAEFLIICNTAKFRK